MADIELVIKISESRYELLQKQAKTNLGREKIDEFAEAVLNGTPLPKGHGRLIDADVFEKRLMNARSYYIGEKADNFDLQFATGLKSAAERLVDAPIIIEADKEQKE